MSTEIRPGRGEEERYVTLDLMRGVAALAVLVYHCEYMFGGTALGMHRGYLAVDFFFILSGFVIAANYHATVRPDLGGATFLAARVARLWPLFLASTLLGAVLVVLKLYRDTGIFDAERIFPSLALNAAMLPAFIRTYDIDRLFIFNGASWSVFFEFAVNLVFFVALRGLQLRPLLMLSAAFGLLLLYVAEATGHLDGGWSAASFHVGAVRVLFGFTLGTALFLLSRSLRFRAGNALAIGAALCLLLSLFAAGDWRIDCALILFAYPLLVLLASRSRLGGFWRPIGQRLGDISYSLYLLQTPVMLLVSGATQSLFGRKFAEFAPFGGIAFVVGMLLVSYLSWRHFELPARNYLRERLAARQQASAWQG